MARIFIFLALVITPSLFASGPIFCEQKIAGGIIGVWKSLVQIDGEPQVVITVRKARDKIDGAFIFRGLTVDSRENVRLELPIANPSFDGAALSFKLSFTESEKTVMEWELRLHSGNEAA